MKYTLDKKADPANGDGEQPTIKSWKTTVVNKTDLKVTLPTPNANFPSVITQSFPWIGSPTAWERLGDKFATHPVGAGPFKLEAFTQNAELTLTRNKYYAEFRPGQPYLDKINVKIASQSSQRLAALQEGQANATWVQGGQEADRARSAGLNVKVLESGGGQRLVLNTAKPPFDDPRARQAVLYALNSSELAEIWAPGSEPMTNLFAENSPYYDSKYDFPKQDTDKAANLFEELRDEGVKLEIDYVGTKPFPQVGAYVQASLEKYPGVHVNVHLEEVSDYISDGRGGNFDIIGFGLHFATPWPALHDNFSRIGSRNFGKWTNTRVENAFSKIVQTQDEETLVANYRILAQEVAEDVPFVPGQKGAFGVALAKSIHNVTLVEYGAYPLTAKLWIE